MNISWLNGININTSFTLTVTVTHQTSIMHVYNTADTFHIFSPTASLCEEYEFQVIAKNDVDTSLTSEAVTSHLPLLPNVHAVESSLQTTVMKGGSGVTVNITHQVGVY